MGFPRVCPRFVCESQSVSLFLKMVLGEVGIDLGGFDILVAHEVPDDLQIHPGHSQPRAIGVAEIVETAFQSGGPGLKDSALPHLRGG